MTKKNELRNYNLGEVSMFDFVGNSIKRWDFSKWKIFC